MLIQLLEKNIKNQLLYKKLLSRLFQIETIVFCLKSFDAKLTIRSKIRAFTAVWDGQILYRSLTSQLSLVKFSVWQHRRDRIQRVWPPAVIRHLENVVLSIEPRLIVRVWRPGRQIFKQDFSRALHRPGFTLIYVISLITVLYSHLSKMKSS